MDKDTLEKLASGEYEISPRSGRLRRKGQGKKKKPFFKRSRVRKTLQNLIWILLILVFLLSIVLVIPELNLKSDKKKDPYQNSKY